MKVKKIDHLNIVVEDLEKTVDFYTSVFGFKATMRAELSGEWFETATAKHGSKAKCVFLELEDAAIRIELLKFLDKTPPPKSSDELRALGIRHFALEVDDIEAVKIAVEKLGLTTISKPVWVPASILPQGKRLFYIKAPDNVIVEVAQYGWGDSQ